MTRTTRQRNGTGKKHLPESMEHRFKEVAAGRTAALAEERLALPAVREEPTALRNGKAAHEPERPALALFCYEYPESAVGRYVANVARALVRQHVVHLFARRPFELDVPDVHDHAVGECEGADILEQVEDFTRRACSAFLEQFTDPSRRVGLLGHEWSSVPALELLRAERKGDFLLALDSLERQRGDLSSDVSRRIEEIELAGLRQAGAVLVQQPAVAEVARFWVPECAPRITCARPPFPVHQFDSRLDPGAVKARFQVGPVDPTVLYIGDVDERHGADVLMKSVPAILKNHPQTRFVFVGDGPLWWPLRVHARYLLLEHAVRMVGHLEGPALYELIQAADIVVVPSREQTEWWPIQAAWAARRPVVASHQTGNMLIEHERDGVLTYPHESSLVWGIERLLFDQGLQERVAARGREKLEERFGWNGVAAQIEELLAVPQGVA